MNSNSITKVLCVLVLECWGFVLCQTASFPWDWGFLANLCQCLSCWQTVLMQSMDMHNVFSSVDSSWKRGRQPLQYVMSKLCSLSLLSSMVELHSALPLHGVVQSRDHETATKFKQDRAESNTIYAPYPPNLISCLAAVGEPNDFWPSGWGPLMVWTAAPGKIRAVKTQQTNMRVKTHCQSWRHIYSGLWWCRQE